MCRAGRLGRGRRTNSQREARAEPGDGRRGHGFGTALLEETVIDSTGRIANGTFADYLIPVNADVPAIDVTFVGEPDRYNAMGIKGIGEIGSVGIAPAIANAVFHATGRRIRSLPITIDKLL